MGYYVSLTKRVDSDRVQISTSVSLSTADVVCTRTAPIHQAASVVPAETASMATDSSARVSLFSLHKHIFGEIKIWKLAELNIE